MRAHVLQHVPFEGPGSIADHLLEAGAQITTTRLFAGEELPAVESIDLLVIMGGPMSANDELKFPWLVAEKHWIKSAVDAQIPTLGICLGAQLIASALGSAVYQNPEPEIGWFPVEAIPSEDHTRFQFPPAFDAFHWHGETFDLPPTATLLARSAACENQAFQIGRSTIGLQFHLETTPESATALIDHCPEDLQPARFIQTADCLRAVPASQYESLNAILIVLLNWLGAPK